MKKWFVLALIACVAIGVQAGDGSAKKKGAGKGGDITKEQFIAQQKKWAEKKGNEFDEAKVSARFDKLDVNKDGKLSADEKAKGKGKAKGEKKAKAGKKAKAKEAAE